LAEESQRRGKADVPASVARNFRALRDKLISAGLLVPSGNKLKLMKNQLFNSPSQAAAVLVGYSINGREAWRLENGVTYEAYAQGISQGLLDSLGLKT
jgi:hypothetical protein